MLSITVDSWRWRGDEDAGTAGMGKTILTKWELLEICDAVDECTVSSKSGDPLKLGDCWENGQYCTSTQ